MRATLAIAACVFVGCTSGGGGSNSLASATSTPGTAVAQSGATMPTDHPTVYSADPLAAGDPVGRQPRRLSAAQLQAALGQATAQHWLGQRSVMDPMRAYGSYEWWQQHDPRSVDMLAALSSTLGQPDFRTSTVENLDPGVTFAKLTNDAARDACRAAISNHTGVFASLPTGLLTDSSRATFDLTFQQLALALWARNDLDMGEMARLENLFVRASTATVSTDGGMPATTTADDGWRAVCIAMITDPQFLTY